MGSMIGKVIGIWLIGGEDGVEVWKGSYLLVGRFFFLLIVDRL